jgi:hypothetical protein
MVVNGYWDSDTALLIACTWLASYVVMHYILLTAKGEAAVEQLSTGAKKTILYSNMVAFLTLILTPMLIGVFVLKTWSDAGDATRWDVKTAYGETITVTTKWKKGQEVRYLFESKYDEPVFGIRSTHEINLLDKDGFTIWSSNVKGYTLIESNGMVTGVSAEGVGDVSCDMFDYRKASSIDVNLYRK